MKHSLNIESNIKSLQYVNNELLQLIIIKMS